MLRLGVIGTGIMGANHARLSTQLRDVELVSVVDPVIERAEALASTYGATAHAATTDIIGSIDLAVVATPTESHHDVALELISHGIHVLVEKPIASTVLQAESLVSAARLNRSTLMVGHVERFNPAVLELDNLIDRPLHITANRVSPYSSRVTVGVVLDLMIHDLDIVLQLMGSEVTKIRAVTSSIHSDSEDLASVLLEFASGSTASLTASRVGQQKIRDLTITQPDNFITVDLLRQDVTINRVDHSEYLSSEGARYRQTGVVEIPFLEHRGEPLALELAEFADAVRTGRPPRVTGEHGAAALRLAEAILDEAKR